MTQEQLNKGTQVILKLAEEDPATWIDRGLLGGLGYGAKNIVEGRPIRGAAQMLGSPLGAFKGTVNALSTASDDLSRSISQLATGEFSNAGLNALKAVYNSSIGGFQGALIGNGLMSSKQKENHDNPQLDRL